MAKKSKKTQRKKVTAKKKTTKKAASKKSAPVTLASLYKTVELARTEIAELKEIITKQLARPIETGPAKQMELFDENTPDTPPQSANGETKLTQEDVSQKLQEVGAKFGLPKVKEILKHFKAKKVSDIAEKDFDKVIKECNAFHAVEKPAPATETSLFD